MSNSHLNARIQKTVAELGARPFYKPTPEKEVAWSEDWGQMHYASDASSYAEFPYVSQHSFIVKGLISRPKQVL